MKHPSILLIAAAFSVLSLNACQKKADNSDTPNTSIQQTDNDEPFAPIISNSVIPDDKRNNLTDELMKEIVNCQSENKIDENDENFSPCNEDKIFNLIRKGASLDKLAMKRADGKSLVDMNQPIYEKDGKTPGEYLYWAGEYKYTEMQHRGRVWNFIRDEIDESRHLTKNQISDDYRLLKHALKTYDKDMMNAILATGMDVNKKYKDGTTPVFYVPEDAGLASHYQNLTFLIEKGADIHIKDNNGNTLLHQGFDDSSNEFLIKKGLDVNAKNNLGQTPLMTSCNSGCFDALLNAGADVNLKDNEGKTVLSYIMALGPENTRYQYLVTMIDNGADLAFLKVPDANGTTPLDAYKTLVNEQFDKMDRVSPTELEHKTYHQYVSLLESDAEFFSADTPRQDRMLKHALAWDYDFALPDFGSAPLLDAKINEQSLKILKESLQNGAALNRAYANGTYPVFLIKDVDSAQILKEAGADFKVLAKDGSSLLHQTLSKPLFEFFLKAGVDPKTINDSGNTPLFYVDAKSPNSEDARSIVKQLLDAGTDAKVVNKEHRNALFGINDVQIVRQLIKAGADASITDNNRENALFHATDPDVIQELLKANADPKQSNVNNETALFRVNNPKSASLLACVTTINVQDVVVADCEKEMKKLIEENKDQKTFEFHCAKVINDKGQTALFTVQDPDTLSVLLKAGIDINHQDNDGKTALFGASLEKQRRLIQNGIDVNIRDNNEKTAIFYVALEDTIAMEKGRWYEPNLTALEELAKAGASLDVIDHNGKNIYQLCREKCHNPETADRLKEIMNAQ